MLNAYKILDINKDKNLVPLNKWSVIMFRLLITNVWKIKLKNSILRKLLTVSYEWSLWKIISLLKIFPTHPIIIFYKNKKTKIV